MGARGEVIPTPVPWEDLPVASAWLLGYVDTGPPGYQLFSSDGNDYAVSVGVVRFDALLAAMNVARGGGETVTAWSPNSKGSYDDNGLATVSLDGSLDRLGYLIGGGVEAGHTGTILPRYIPPAGIPLLGYQWDRVEKDADRRVLVDLYRRNQGYTWGSAEIFQCRLYMHRYAYEALQNGWCTRGKVTIGGADKLDTPWSVSDPKGAITGYVLGLGSVEWRGQTQANVVVEMTIAKES